MLIANVTKQKVLPCEALVALGTLLRLSPVVANLFAVHRSLVSEEGLARCEGLLAWSAFELIALRCFVIYRRGMHPRRACHDQGTGVVLKMRHSKASISAAVFMPRDERPTLFVARMVVLEEIRLLIDLCCGTGLTQA